MSQAKLLGSYKMLSLKEIGLKYGTDKATDHQFCDFYESHLNHLRFEKIKLLEIGIYQNQSMMMWREYFPNAEIHGIDIVEYSDNKVDNVNYHCIDIENTEALTNFINDNYDWDVVIDDGGHTMKQQQFSFKYFLGIMKKPAIFIMEDLHSSFEYWKSRHNPNNDPTTYQMIENIKNKKDFVSPYINRSEYRYCLSQIDSVDIFAKNPDNLNFSVTSILKK